jgi:23S rRNA pseudouridine2605 synthase
MTRIRLQKFLAECGVGSRRKMEEFIREGRVRVNGMVVTTLGKQVDPAHDSVEVNRRKVRPLEKGLMLLNKPRGVVSTLSDPEGRRTVGDFLTKKQYSYFPVGRLDWDSTGLMLLTNDGELAERLMHPRYGFERVYHARVEGSVSVSTLTKLQRGIRLSGVIVKAAGAILKSDSNSTWIEVTIAEGRNRVVRRIFEKLRHPVIKLKRIVYGPFKLGRLQVGQVRTLTQSEYETVRKKVFSNKQSESTTDKAAVAAKEDDTRKKDGVKKPSAKNSGRRDRKQPSAGPTKKSSRTRRGQNTRRRIR